MRKKLYEARASALNEVAKAKGGSVFVLAAMLDNNDPVYSAKQETASHDCKSCGTGFSTVAALASPFCPNCGSGSVKASKEQAQPLPKTDKELAFLVCPGCETANILHDVTATMFDGHFHCVTCGGDIAYEVQSDGAGSEPVVMESRDPDGKIADTNDDQKQGNAPAAEVKELVEDTKTPQVNPPVLSKDKQTADDKGIVLPTETGEQDRPISDADAGDVKDLVNKDLKGIPSVQKAAEEPISEPVVEELSDDDFQGDQQDQDMAAVVTAEDDDKDTDKDGDVDKDDAFGGKKAPPFKKKDESCESAVRISALSTLMAFGGDKELSISSVGDRVMAFVNDIHVATLTAEAAQNNAQHMHKPAFARAVAAAVGEKGIKAGLDSYGFTLATIVVPQKAIIAKMVAKETKAVAARLEEEAASFSQTFMQCMSIAAAGLNKGFFSKEENALKRGFYDILSANGVKGAEKLIDKVFSSNGDVYHKTLLQLAETLMAKPIEVRNSMAESVQETAYMTAVTADEQEEEDDDQDAEASVLQNLETSSIIPIRRTSQGAETASIKKLRAGSSFFPR